MSAYRCAAGWAVTRLLADSQVKSVVAGRVFEGLAPMAATYPLITVQSYTDPVDTNYSGGRALTVVSLLVRVWDRAPDSQGSSAARIAPVADRVDVLLHGAPVTVRPDGVIRSSQRTNEVESTEYRDRGVVRCLGGRFELSVGALPA